jgi:predicted nucleic acid-binding protein
MRYLDTSFVGAYFLAEDTSASVQRVFSDAAPGTLAISHWTGVEFFSLLAIRRRMGTLTDVARKNVAIQFEIIAERSFTVFLPAVEDFTLAKEYLADHSTGLRGGDALHLAIAANRRVEAIHSLDKTMIKAGATLGLPVSAAIR